MTDQPCRCWTGPAIIHTDHCCFRAGTTEDYRPGHTPCGHTGPKNVAGTAHTQTTTVGFEV